jgi:hypothetical protein
MSIVVPSSSAIFRGDGQQSQKIILTIYPPVAGVTKGLVPPLALNMMRLLTGFSDWYPLDEGALAERVAPSAMGRQSGDPNGIYSPSWMCCVVPFIGLRLGDR